MLQLKAIREARGLTQTEAAKELGISRQAYYNYESGRREADYEMLLRMGELFDVSIEELIGGCKFCFAEKPCTEQCAETKNAPEQKAPRASESEILTMLEKMDDESLKMLLDYTRYLLWRQIQNQVF
jgi:transcriptional regulator with XRE-family HTH domain